MRLVAHRAHTIPSVSRDEIGTVPVLAPAARGVDDDGDPSTRGTTVTAMREPAPAGHAAGGDIGAEPGGPAVDPVLLPEHDTMRLPDGLADLALVLDRCCEELFAAVPFLGDQATGAAVNSAVDELVSALRVLRDDADDLRRVVEVSERGGRGGADAVEH